MENLENIGLDCPCYDLGDCTVPTFEIGDFIPIGANNGKLTIEQNGVVIGEFYADQSEDTTVNITGGGGGGDAVWGGITGDIQNQSDLIELLDNEATLRSEEDNRLDGEINQLGTELNLEVNARTQADATLTQNFNTAISQANTRIDSVESDIDDVSSEITAETTARTQADTALQNQINTKAEISALTAETTNRENSDTALQSQIDAITSKSDIVDIVGTKAELDSYDTSDLGDNDIIKVLMDSTHDNSPSYYRWHTSTRTWSYVGSESVAFTKAEAETLFVPKTRTINNKALSANVTLTTSDLANDSGYLTSADLTGYVQKTDYADATAGGVIKVNSAYGIKVSSGNLAAMSRAYDQYVTADNSMFIGKATLENVISGKGLATITIREW